jgi:pilus assembly protein CpaF
MSILKRIQGADNGQQLSSGSEPPQAPGTPPRRMTSPSAVSYDTYQDLKTRVQTKLLSVIDTHMDVTKVAEVRRTIQGNYSTKFLQKKA